MDTTTMDTDTIEDKLRKVAEIRKEIREKLFDYDCKKAKIEQSEGYVMMLRAKEIADELIESENILLSEIRERALERFFASNFEAKKPAPGVEIKKFTVLKIKDEKSAKEWAAHNAPNTLRLDERTLQKVIAGGVEVDWASIKDDYRAQISSDLSEYLEK